MARSHSRRSNDSLFNAGEAAALGRTSGRRGIMKSAVTAAIAAFVPRAHTTVREPIYAGAIRWDAWEASNSSVNRAVATSLSPPQFHTRAPFCAAEHGGAIGFGACDTQVAMDAEIAFAAAAGIAYWAYCWYGINDPMARAWSLHQSSENRNRVKWCLLLQFSRMSSLATLVSTYVAYFRQPNYQHAAGVRPLVYVSVDQMSHLASDWRGDWTNLHTVLEKLATACAAAGVNRPYIVIMSGSPATSRDILRALNADAISNYTGRIPSGRPASYQALDKTTQAYWAEMAATGVPIVPICMTGWDTRPRKLHPPPWNHGQTPGAGMDTYVEPGTPAEIARHVRAAVDYITAHPAACPSRNLLIYSWDECDEGGSPLIPTFSPKGPNRAILDAVSAVLR